MESGTTRLIQLKLLKLFCNASLEAAIHAYEMALAIVPKYIEGWNNKGLALYSVKRYQESLKSYEQAFSIDATNDRTLKGMKLAIDSLKGA